MLSNSCSPTAGAAKSNVPLETASNGIGINLFAWTGTADGAGEEVGDGRGVTVDIIVAVDVGRIVEGGVALLVGEGVGVWEGTTGVGGGGGGVLVGEIAAVWGRQRWNRSMPAMQPSVRKRMPAMTMSKEAVPTNQKGTRGPAVGVAMGIVGKDDNAGNT